MAGLLYSFYGDDFTGSTDVLEQLAGAGVQAALFLHPPTARDLSLVRDVQAIGIAGDSRSRTPEWMSSHLPRVFEALRSLGAQFAHYKVCSTFDSSPRHGSIGRAMEIGREIFEGRYIPIVVGAPHLRRFVWQGQLFASDALGEIQRIDRHPMSRHPVTPMREAELRRHLALQTQLRIGEVRETSAELIAGALKRELKAGCEAAVFDTFTTEDLANVGRLLWHETRRKTLFGVGSSGLTAALIAAWRETGLTDSVQVPAVGAPRSQGAGSPLLVVSGSCSAATERQLRWALANGFKGIPIEPKAMFDLESGPRLHAQVVRETIDALAADENPMIYTAMGKPTGASQGGHLGTALGVLVRDVLAQSRVRRVLLCGGDTSSHAVQQLGVRALTWGADLQAGVPLCVAHGTGVADGLELVLKGGQVGSEDFFAVVRDAVV